MVKNHLSWICVFHVGTLSQPTPWRRLHGGFLRPLREVWSRMHVCVSIWTLPQMKSFLCCLVLSSLAVSSQHGESPCFSVQPPGEFVAKLYIKYLYVNVRFLINIVCSRFGGCFLQSPGPDSQRRRRCFLQVCLRGKFTSCRHHLAQRREGGPQRKTDSGTRSDGFIQTNSPKTISQSDFKSEQNKDENQFFLCLLVQGEYGGGHQKKTSGTLHLYNVTLEDDGTYVCVTLNPSLNISSNSKPAKLTVQGECTWCYVVSNRLCIETQKCWVYCQVENQKSIKSSHFKS